MRYSSNSLLSMRHRSSDPQLDPAASERLDRRSLLRHDPNRPVGRLARGPGGGNFQRRPKPPIRPSPTSPQSFPAVPPGFDPIAPSPPGLMVRSISAPDPFQRQPVVADPLRGNGSHPDPFRSKLNHDPLSLPDWRRFKRSSGSSQSLSELLRAARNKNGGDRFRSKSDAVQSPHSHPPKSARPKRANTLSPQSFPEDDQIRALSNSISPLSARSVEGDTRPRANIICVPRAQVLLAKRPSDSKKIKRPRTSNVSLDLPSLSGKNGTKKIDKLRNIRNVSFDIPFVSPSEKDETTKIDRPRTSNVSFDLTSVLSSGKNETTKIDRPRTSNVSFDLTSVLSSGKNDPKKNEQPRTISPSNKQDSTKIDRPRRSNSSVDIPSDSKKLGTTPRRKSSDRSLGRLERQKYVWKRVTPPPSSNGETPVSSPVSTGNSLVSNDAQLVSTG
eukprot:664576_1